MQRFVKMSSLENGSDLEDDFMGKVMTSFDFWDWGWKTANEP